MRVPGVCRKRRFFRTLKQKRRRLTGSPMSKSSFHIRVWMVAFLLILCLAFSAAALGGENFPLVGDWAFNHAPEKTVLLVRDDGTAVYDGRDWTWEGDETFLNLQNTEGETFSIRYAADEDGIRIYLPGDYTRRDKLVDEEIARSVEKRFEKTQNAKNRDENFDVIPDPSEGHENSNSSTE